MKERQNKLKILKKYALQIKAFAVIVVILICGLVYISSRNEKDDEKDTVFMKESLASGSEIASEILEVYVYICGEVNIPGVYKCAENARIFEVVELAGGFTEDADISSNNMAAQVKDGQKILIPSKMSEGSQDEAVESGIININTATKEQLMTLPGIGESRACDIIAYRESVNGFNSIEEIMNVSGIKTAAFNKIKDMIIV